AGLRPSAVDTGFGALARLFSQQFRRESDRQHVRAVLDVGHSGSTITILRGEQIAFCKPLNIGGKLVNKAASEHLQMDPAAAADLRIVRIVAEEAARTGRQARCELAESGDDLSGLPAIDNATDRAVYEAVRPLVGDLTREVTLCLRYY